MFLLTGQYVDMIWRIVGPWCHTQ